jgi:hypothetical protein
VNSPVVVCETGTGFLSHDSAELYRVHVSTNHSFCRASYIGLIAAMVQASRRTKWPPLKRFLSLQNESPKSGVRMRGLFPVCRMPDRPFKYAPVEFTHSFMHLQGLPDWLTIFCCYQGPRPLRRETLMKNQTPRLTTSRYSLERSDRDHEPRTGMD